MRGCRGRRRCGARSGGARRPVRQHGYAGVWARAQDAAKQAVNGLGSGDRGTVAFFDAGVEVPQRHFLGAATCRQQAKAFETMRAEPGHDMKLLVVDFDEDRETSRAFRVIVPGTVVVLRGHAERARLMGVIDPRQLRAALRGAL